MAYGEPVSPSGLASAIVASPDPFFRDQMLSTLRASNWYVEEAVGGADALAKLESNNCQVLLLDHWLADLDVMELVGIVRRRHPGLSVYVVDAASAMPILTQEPEDPQHRNMISELLSGLRQPQSQLPAQADPTPVLAA